MKRVNFGECASRKMELTCFLSPEASKNPGHLYKTNVILKRAWLRNLGTRSNTVVDSFDFFFLWKGNIYV